MGSTVQARLDEDSKKLLARLVKQLRWSQSRVVREGLRLLAACHPRREGKRVIGLGKFRSGVPDLGSNKKHLEGFGR